MFRLARPEDEPKILSSLANSPMRVGGMELVYDRHPSFAELLRLQAPEHLTLVAEEQNEIRGFASFSSGERYVDGRPVRASYAGDLRARTTRGLARAWRPFYGDFLRSLGSDWVYTAILKDNLAAQRSLVEQKRNRGFHYHWLSDATMVNVLAKLPVPFMGKAAFDVETAEDQEDALRDFLERVNRSSFLGYRFDRAPGNEWDRRAAIWPGYRAEKFLVAKNIRGEIVACAFPWSPGYAKRMQVRSLGLPTSLAFRALSRLGMNIPRQGQPIETLYLTHLHYNPGLPEDGRARVVALFLDHLRSEGAHRKYHMISYPDFADLRKQTALRPFLSQNVDVKLYLVSPFAETLAVAPGQEIVFEMGLV